MRTDFLTADIPSLFPFLETVLQDGGKKLYEINGDVRPFRNFYGYSGFDYEEGDQRGQFAFGTILGGTGYVVRRVSNNGQVLLERHDYFNNKGEATFSSDKEALKALIVDEHEMDLTCPILNHLYNFLSFEYKQAGEGNSKTELVHSVETYLYNLYRSKIIRLPIKDRVKDPAIFNIFNKMLAAEMDPVLTWEERQVVFSNYRETIWKIVSTKCRAHKLSTVYFKLALFSHNLSNFITRFISRPMNNAKGIFYRYTVGKVIWFFQTVKNNLGYSIALAVYGPFTYYFITMPMNPHAMQAVGKVRSTYLDIKTEVGSIMDKGSVVMSDMSSKKAIAAPIKDLEKKVPESEVSDTVATKAASASKPTTVEGKTSSATNNIIYQSLVTGNNEPLLINMGQGKSENVQPNILNMILSGDVEKVNTQSWLDRMSNFKQMQIAYEENIEYASRLGRLEQLETQYNFPMQVENTWEELERYSNAIFKIREENPDLSAKMKQYLFNEIDRTQQLQLYLWDRMGRFMLDQIYVMLDQDKEQKRNDYYVGRSFVFMQEMTKVLSWRYKDLKRPEGYDRIEKLAEFYVNTRKEHGSVMQNLANNSDLFKQKDILSTKEFRSYMKRQWEILYLQNAKAEEASNMGLNMYIWSVRNTMWVLQSMYSSKREELALLIKRDTTGQMFSPSELLSRSRISMLYETLFHNLTLEYVGIREEIMNRLGKDLENAQRMMVINNLKEFFSDREKLDGVGVAASEKSTAGATL